VGVAVVGDELIITSDDEAALDRIVLASLQTLTTTDPQGASSLVPLLPPGETQTFAAVAVARWLATTAVRTSGSRLRGCAA
jgi:hypothetical protein